MDAFDFVRAWFTGLWLVDRSLLHPDSKHSIYGSGLDEDSRNSPPAKLAGDTDDSANRKPCNTWHTGFWQLTSMDIPLSGGKRQHGQRLTAQLPLGIAKAVGNDFARAPPG